MLVRPGPPDIAAEQPIATYRVLYRVRAAGVPERREERIAVRPYSGSDITRDIDGSIVSGQLHNDDGVFQYRRGDDAASTGWLKLFDKRHLAPSDFRPVPAVRDQLRHGHVRKLGTRVVAGRRCNLVRIGGPLADTDTFKRPTARDHADICLDRTGIALQEHWTLRGKRARRLDALSFQPNFHPDADTLQPAPRLPDPPVGSLGQLALDITDKTKKSFVVKLDSFDGFRPDGGLLEVTLGATGATGGTATLRFRHGFELVQLSQHQNAPTKQPGDRTEHVAPWGTVRFHPDTFASSYEVPLGGNQWARLQAPDLDALRAALHKLRRVKK